MESEITILELVDQFYELSMRNIHDTGLALLEAELLKRGFAAHVYRRLKAVSICRTG